jgi:hypothetical protein
MTQCIFENFEKQWIWNLKTASPCGLVQNTSVQIPKYAAVEFGLFPDVMKSSVSHTHWFYVTSYSVANLKVCSNKRRGSVGCSGTIRKTAVEIGPFIDDV